MKKIKTAFLTISLVIVVLMVLWFNQFDFVVNRSHSGWAPGNNEFQVTAISGLGNVFLDPAYTRPVDLKVMDFSGDTNLNSDEQTSFEFFYQGVVFIALPGSRIQYSPQTKELYLIGGEFFWNRKAGGNRVEVSFLKPENMISISNSGRIRLKGDSSEIWNYTGELDFVFDGGRRHINPMQWIAFRGKVITATAKLLPPPQFISPESEMVAIADPRSVFVPFKWKNVPGVKSYLIKLYPSPLRENVFFSNVVSSNGVTVDISPFIDNGRLYWDVCAFDVIRGVESCPSAVGSIEWKGGLVRRDSAGLPPKIVIESLSVSGNVVLIRGMTDANGQLIINDVPVKVDADGKFIHTISYRTIGTKEILLHVSFPAGLVNTVKRQVTIFEEVSEE